MPQLSLNLSSHNNHFLFSDHYLDDILRRTPLWQREIVPQAESFFTWLKALYQKEKAQLPQYKEAQLEENWLKPILRQLGHEFEGQGTIPALTQAKIRYPDYLFFANEAERHAAATSPNSALHARAVGEVKRWGVPLNRKTKGGGSSFDDNNPSYQIDYYLRATDLTWGILSNGQQWRLVHKESSYKLDVYFEIDLEKALENESLGAIAYFYAFFRQAALLPDNQGRIFLNDALQDSRAYALQLESDLRENAYKALEQLILGFLAPSRNRLDVNNPAHRQQVYDNSLYLLYRILFLFYGESRGLLPMPNPEYRNYSLQALAQTAADLVDEGKNIPPMTTIHWAHLRTLFQIINGDDEALNQHLGVPRYNGGLFNPALYPFLDEHVVGDRHLIQAIDYLGRRAVVREGRYAGRERVDYRTLGVRQLGSIYEGLLEYQPRQASEPMAAVRQKGAEKWLPASQVKGRTEILERREPGELYLATDKGERKATGSYYTPDYIVKYIVEQTLGPLVERVRQEAAGDTARFVAGILQLNVLDPAMGSGHFLVEATDFLARALATGADVPGADNLPKVLNLRKVNEEADDLVYWRRQVVERCIYGVDKNRLAVELAKLSLWLVTVAADQPLSFLDHHLRHGDSLVGARLADLAHAPGPTKNKATTDEQLLLFDEGVFAQDAFRAVGGMLTIEGMLSESIDDIHAKEQLYTDLRGHLSRWKQQADLWVSYYFGNAYSREEYADLARYWQQSGNAEELADSPTRLLANSLLTPQQRQPFLTHPAVVANDYFHWELEFPELFFDRNGQPLQERAGFDAVIGNPPYFSISLLNDNEKDFLSDVYSLVYSGNSDVMYYFIKTGIDLNKRKGLLGLIVPRYFIKAHFADKLRDFILKESTLKKLVDFNNFQVFPDADVLTILLFIQRGQPVSKAKVNLLSLSNSKLTSQEVSNGLLNQKGQEFEDFFLDIDVLSSSPWHLFQSNVLAVKDKLLACSQPLHRYFTVVQSMQTGRNSVFVVDERTINDFGLEQPLLKKLAKTGNVRRYYIEDLEQYVLWTEEIQDLLDYPNTSAYLTPFQLDLADRYDIKARKSEWWKMSTPRNAELFLSQQPRIITPFMSTTNKFYLDKEQHFNDGGDLRAIFSKEGHGYSLYYLLSLLNSKAGEFFHKNTAKLKRDGYYEYYGNALDNFPVREIKFSGENKENLLAAATTHYHQSHYPALLTLVQDCLSAQPEQADVVHDILAFLAEQMIALNQEKQTLVGRFWTDLEGVTDAAAFPKLRDKGKQEASLVQAVPSLAQFLNPASKSGKTLDESLAWSEEGFKGFAKLLVGKISGLSDLLDVYRRHAPEYRRLSQQLADTDQLIDQIVYRLYGLTEEEIALVEGTPV